MNFHIPSNRGFCGGAGDGEERFAEVAEEDAGAKGTLPVLSPVMKSLLPQCF